MALSPLQRQRLMAINGNFSQWLQKRNNENNNNGSNVGTPRYFQVSEAVMVKNIVIFCQKINEKSSFVLSFSPELVPLSVSFSWFSIQSSSEVVDG